MFVFYLVISVSCFLTKCLALEGLTPSCKINNPMRIVNCSRMDNLDNLRGTFYKEMNTSSTPIIGVHIANSYFSFIAQDFFKGLNFWRLTIENTTLISLSDTDTAFEGLEKHLKVFQMKNSVLYKDLDWYQLRNLAKLTFLTMENVGLEYVESDVDAISEVKLLQLSLANNRISFISDRAFAPFLHLQSLWLNANSISELKRSMFPNPGNKLQQLNLG